MRLIISLALVLGTMLVSCKKKIDFEIKDYKIEKDSISKELKLNLKEHYSMDEDDFINQEMKVYNVLMDHLNNYEEKYSIEDSTLTKLKASIEFKKNINFIDYEPRHGRYIKDRNFKSSDKIKKFYKDADINNSELLGVKNYGIFILYVKEVEALNLRKSTPELKEKLRGYNEAEIIVIDKYFTDKKVKDYVSFKTLENILKSNPDSYKTIIPRLRSNCFDKYHNKFINEKLSGWKTISKGQSAKEITGIDVNGKSVSLSDFKGKYVYIDIWATWCGPCCGEIPYLEKLEKEYHGRNITFLSVSVDDDMDKWKKKVKDDKLGGIQINVGHRTNISKDYMISGIPRFMLFDTEGKIVTVSAPRPSGKIREVLDGLKNL